MNKGLVALNDIRAFHKWLKETTRFCMINFDERANAVEKELKALNVFRELKFFDVRCNRENGKMIYLLVWNAISVCRISKSQYERLKEIL